MAKRIAIIFFTLVFGFGAGIALAEPPHPRDFNGTISAMNGTQLILQLANGATNSGIEDVAFPGLFVGERVQARGYVDGKGVFHITGVAQRGPSSKPPKFHRKRSFNGRVTSIVGNQVTLRMNNGSTITGIENVSAPGLAIGQRAHVKGYFDQNGVFQITKLKIKSK